MFGRVDAGAWPLSAWLLGDFLFVLADIQEVFRSLRTVHPGGHNYRVLTFVVIVTPLFAASGECVLVEAS